MPPSIVVYEDHGWQRLLPLVYTRAVFQLRSGMGDLLGTVRRLVDHSAGAPRGNGRPATGASLLSAWCRPVLAELVGEQTGLEANLPASGAALFLNGRARWQKLPGTSREDSSWVGVLGKQRAIACVYADTDLASRLSPSVFLDETRSRAVLAGLPRRDVGDCLELFDWPWQLVLSNEQALLADWEQHSSRAAENDGQVAEGAYLLNRPAIHIGAGSRIKPCAVIDAEDGPVWIGQGVTILPQCYVQGPAFLGDGCLLQPGAVVHAGTTIGPGSKVGGEIEASIIHGYSNKQHDGFLGHSYLGSWVNVAADCINSDLKNTYGSVRVPVNGREIDSGEMFVGMFMGDHSKAGINVSFPTGAVIGFCSSVFAPRSPKFVPSFAWIDGEKTVRYDEQRGVMLARKVMARRRLTMTAAEERVFLAVRRQALALEHQPQRELELVRTGD